MSLPRATWILAFITACLLAMGLILAFPAQAQSGNPPEGGQQEETPVMMSTSTRLTPPPTVDPPTPADLGAQVYFYRCMVCHGDRGQGLTEEWRHVLGPPDENCWQARCHGPRFGVDGFQLPKQVPPVIVPGILNHFENAKNLHEYLVTKMPWQQPGLLSADEYWQLTAYLVRANDYNPGTKPLDDASAEKITFTKAPAPPALEVPAYYYALGCVTGLVVVLLAGSFLRRRLAKPK